MVSEIIIKIARTRIVSTDTLAGVTLANAEFGIKLNPRKRGLQKRECMVCSTRVMNLDRVFFDHSIALPDNGKVLRVNNL